MREGALATIGARLKHISPVGLILAGVAVGPVLGLLGALGGVSPTLDLLNHATPLWFWMSLGVLLASALMKPRRFGLALLGLAGAAASGSILMQDLPARPQRLEPGAPTITLMSQNVWIRNPRPQMTAEVLSAYQPDILMLVEAEGSGREVAQALRGVYPYSTHCLDNHYCQVEIFSRYPIVSWRRHVASWRPAHRGGDYLGWVSADIDTGAGRITVYATKLLHPWPGGFQERQIAQLTALMAAIDTDRAVVMGDFNLTPWSFRLRRLDRALELQRVTRGLGTWPARLPIRGAPRWLPGPFLPIDHAYVGRAWRPVAVRRTKATGSDHYAVEITLTPNSQAPNK